MSGLDERLLPSTVDPLDRPRFLREYQHTWKTLKWTIHKSIPGANPVNWVRPITFRHGVLAYLSRSMRTIHLTRFPSPLLGIGGAEWDVDLVSPEHLIGYQIDPSQDLLVTVSLNTCPDDESHSSCRVCVLSMTGGNHSSGTSEFSCIVPRVHDTYPNPNTGIPGVTIHVQGSLVAILFDGRALLDGEPADPDIFRNQVMVVWDWKAAEMKTQLHLMPHPVISGLGFLSDELLCVLVKHYGEGAAATPTLLVFKPISATPARSLEDYDPIVAFSLPAPFWEFSLSAVSLQVDPVPQSSTGGLAMVTICGSPSRAEDEGLDHYDLDHYNLDHYEIISVVIFIPISFLVRRFTANVDRHCIIPWSMWGPFNTRTVPLNGWYDDTDPEIRLSGLRAAAHSESDSAVCIYDFDPLRVGRARGDEEATVSDSSHVPSDFWNEGELFTDLPCLVTEVELPQTVRWSRKKLPMISELGLLLPVDGAVSSNGFEWFGF